MTELRLLIRGVVGGVYVSDFLLGYYMCLYFQY